MKIIFPTLSACLLLAGTAAASEKCSVPMADWQPREALQTKLEGQGWTVRSIRSEDGCYEAYALNAKGEKVEAYFDPKTFVAVDLKTED
ncbi:PepSY domain-containing protein [Rhizobium sp. SG2393]|uniref:PepSY domain-containing protein n=1 Tax=Rhizobium sp. SG2393 TaxID=3276279 RepID=UPI00366AA3D9